MKSIKKNSALFAVGGTLYPLLEILWRGYSHISMAFAGGICVVLINRVCCEVMKGKRLIVKALTGGGIITAVEFLIGLITNVFLGLRVWDYSNTPFNILGQVCLPFSLAWTAISVPVIYFCRWFTGLISRPEGKETENAKPETEN